MPGYVGTLLDIQDQAHEAFDDEGELVDPELRARLADIITALVGANRPCVVGSSS